MAALVLLASAMVLSPPAGDYVTLKGQILWKGDLPKLVPVNVTTDQEVCCNGGPLMPTDLLVDTKSKGLKNVVVWVRPDTDDRKDTFPKERIDPKLAHAKPVKHTIDQPNCQIEPRMLAARAGDTLEVKNSSTTPHNVHFGFEDESAGSLLPLSNPYTLAKPLVAQATPIPVTCAIHPWMQGSIRVFAHPYFAVTDKDGRFEIPGVPAGKWRLVYWHEKGYHKGRAGILGVPTDVRPDRQGGIKLELKPVEFEFPPPR